MMQQINLRHSVVMLWYPTPFATIKNWAIDDYYIILCFSITEIWEASHSCWHSDFDKFWDDQNALEMF